ncbi:MAG: carboxypeptidase-like regulatory domain-containing protein [Longimicrobiales bacterium]
MPFRFRRAPAFGVLLLCTLFAPVPVSAQTVLLRVLSADTGQPVFGALAYLIDDQGQPLRTVLTDERGRALFVGVPPARYRVRAEMIGMGTRETPAFEVAQGATDVGEMTLDPRPIDLERIDVTAERRRCTARPAGEGLLVASLWEEARKALSAAALTERQGQYRYETMRYERDVDAERRLVLREEESQRDGYMRAPFESLPPEDFAQGGFVRRDGSELVYYAPDASVLLSEAFLDAHCFRVVAGEEASDVVGLSFEPMERRGSFVDISGTLWLDDRTAELRWLEYAYANLDLDVAAPTAGGRVEFQRMEAGTWIIPEWWIEMPIIDTRFSGDGGSRPVLRGLRRSGGRVLAVHGGGGRTLTGRRQTGGIEGVVVDSAGAPIQGARVGVVGGSQEVFTDAEGRFGLLGLSEGTFQVRFVDPALVGSGLAAPYVEREVLVGEVSYLEFHMPSVGDMLIEACTTEAMEPSVGVLVGRVLDETGGAWPAATVRAMWSSVQFLGTPGRSRVYFEDQVGLEIAADENGAYRLCGVPRESLLSVSTLVDGREEPAGSVTLGASEPGRVHEIRRSR